MNRATDASLSDRIEKGKGGRYQGLGGKEGWPFSWMGSSDNDA